MKKFLKPKVILYFILGIIIGGLLFAIGEYDDAPGMCAIGLSIGFILIMLGINKTGIIKKEMLAPILLFFFAAFIALITTAILFDGEFGDKPWYAAFGFVTAIVLLLLGLLKKRRFINKQ
jgi:O-antigen/teichoic acid export membrane protein